MSSRKPLIVGIGGTTRIGSTTERALSVALRASRVAQSAVRYAVSAAPQNRPSARS